MTDLLEALMILCFGLSWPISIRKSLRSRTAKGKSLFFEFFIWIGYVFGICPKISFMGRSRIPTVHSWTGCFIWAGFSMY